MRDLTHYFHLPPKEESTNQKENIEIGIEPQSKSEKKHTKSKSLSDTGSRHSSPSIIISKNEEKVMQSSSKIKSKVVKSDRKNTVIVEHNTSRDIEFPINDNVENEAKTPVKKSTKNERSSVQTSSGKEKKCLSLNKSRKLHNSDKHASIEKEDEAEVAVESHDREICFEKISKKNTNIDVPFNDKSKKKRNSSLREGKPSSHKSLESCNALKSKLVSDDESKRPNTSDKEDSLKTPPLLDDNRNAFYILMSSRTWKSPHDDVNKSGNESSSPEKKIKKNDSTTPLQSAEMKENNRKRKKKLEKMVEQKVAKKIKYIGTEEETVKKSNRTSKRILIVPDSDSEDDDTALLNNSLKSKNCPKEMLEDVDLLRKKESVESIELEIKKTPVKDLKKPIKTKLIRNKKTLKNKLQNSLSSKTDTLIVEESEYDSIFTKNKEKPAKKKVRIDFDQCYVNLEGRLSPRKLNSSTDRQATTSKNKLIIESSKSDTKRDVKKEVTGVKNKRERRKSDDRISRKLSLENKTEVNNKTSVRKSSDTVDTYVSNSVSQECTNLKSKTNFRHTPKKNKSFAELDSESSCHLVTPDRKKRSEKVLVRESVNSNEVLNVVQNDEKLSEQGGGMKKRNSLFSYFNKVSKDEISVSEKIQVKAQIHSPPASPSSKRRSTTVSKVNMEQKRQNSRNKVSDKEDQIIVVESVKLSEMPSPKDGMKTPEGKGGVCWLRTPPSNNWRMRVKLRESSVESASDSDDDCNSFTPRKRKKWANRSTSVQQKVAREVLRKAKTRVTQRKSQDLNSPTSDVNVEEEDSDEVLICSSSEKNKPDASVKLAPLFIRKTPKPKLDPAIVEARKNFLKSGVPEPVKKFVDLQRSMEENCQFTFPSVAHVQQKDTNTSVWNLPVVKVSSQCENTDSPVLFSKEQLQFITLGSFTSCSSISTESVSIVKPSLPEPIKHFRKLLHLLKMESPNFPVYRNFRKLRLKNNIVSDQEHPEDVKDTKQKRRSNNRKSRTTKTSIDVEEETVESCSSNSHVMWTEKYKPQAAEDVISNLYSVEQLKKWLESWKNYNDEMLRKDRSGGHKRKDSSSGDEFMDSDSNDSSNGNLPNNTAILVGPHGCGKTAAVYAIANELGCKVLEINTSSKRNGKRILSELQEATQSHQVRAGGDHTSAGALNSFLKGGTTKSKKKKSKVLQEVSKSKQEGDENKLSKLSLILVEGVDVVYEDYDEGFVSALNTLVTSSKRPVILITNVPHCSHLSKFMDTQLVLTFTAPQTRSMSIWLQLVCLLEGIRVSRTEVERLLDQNEGDVRQTLLQLQFWTLSGGNNLPLDKGDGFIDHPKSPSLIDDDEHSNLSLISDEEPDDTPLRIPEHSSCVEIFMEYVEQKSNNLQLPFPSDVSCVWWNLASLLSIPEALYHDRISSQILSSDDVELKDNSEADVGEMELDKNDKDSDTVSQGDERIEKQCDKDTEMTCEAQKQKTELNIISTKENTESNNISVNKTHLLEKQDSGVSLLETDNNSEMKRQSSDVKKSECSQLEADSFYQLLERMSALDVISHRIDFNYVSRRDPCVRNWDQYPRDGTSLSETVNCQWWENSFTKTLCHCLLENGVRTCRLQLQEARNCQEEMKSARVIFIRPTQSELRWRSSQHAADDSLLPAVPLWYRSDHHSVSSDYFPMLRTVSRCEQDRLTSNTKRRNRFFHYLKGLNVHVNENILRTLCTMFERKVIS